MPRTRQTIRTAIVPIARILCALGMAWVAQQACAQREIVFATGDAPYKAGFDKLARQYEDLHPGVRVRVMVIPSDGYATWIRTAVAGGDNTSPDIFNFNMAKSLYETGRAVSLKPYLLQPSPYNTRHPTWADTFHPQYLEMLKQQGDYPSVPLNFIEIGFYYNKDLFAKAGVAPPKTWQEFDEICTKLRATGITPMVMAADFENVWSGTFGWMVRLLTDVYFFDRIPILAAHPGDHVFDPTVDGKYVLNTKDLFGDMLLNLPMERQLQAILDGDLRFDGPEMGEVYTTLKRMSTHWQSGFLGTNMNSSIFQHFLSGRAAIMLHTSAGVLQWDAELKLMEPNRRFEVGVFQFPPITNSPLARIPIRGVGAPMPIYGIIRKSRAQNDLAADFLMYITTPEACRLIYDEAVGGGQSIVGPFATKDVDLPPEVSAKFEPFLNRGREKIQLRGLFDEQQSTWRWAISTQDYIGGRLTLDQFLANYQSAMVETIPRIIKSHDLDMDPRTRDNNAPLIRDIMTALRETTVPRQMDATATEQYAQDLIASLCDMAHPTSIGLEVRGPLVPADWQIPQGQRPPDLVVERTIPILFATDPAQFAHLNTTARDMATQFGYQYAMVTNLATPTPGQGDDAVKLHSFRPDLATTILAAKGRRYTPAELDRLWPARLASRH